ncbi:undecaprenyl phosphate N,N'-diacetylbacillosamine 1-phosphate transferase, partial [Campylobacter jejuni]|nr:undecaprenyl phosphate N,N'-diacetylbacillosamine 1-phosphate transferase [Campylobacter jejuni]
MYEKVFKRIFDFILALVLLVLFSPVILITALLLKITQGGVIFTQNRPGLDEKIFKIY